MAATRDADVVIVGLGAAGGIAARALAEAGAVVVALEAGPARPAGRASRTRPDWQGRPTVRLRPGEVARPVRDPAPAFGAVGGAKHVSAAQSYRLPDWAFRIRTEAERAGAAGLSDGVTAADWPLDAAQLRPYYERVERLLGVAGAPAGRAALPGARWTERMAGAARSLGWRPFPAPAAIRHTDGGEGGDGGCVLCGDCTGRPCPWEAKAVVGPALLAPAIGAGRLDVRTRAVALEVTVDDAGLATGVRYLCSGTVEHQRAAVVVLASYTYENVRLLLLSRSRAFPDGLANRAGQVGRHFMTHSFVEASGTFPDGDPGRRGGTAAQATAIAEFDVPAPGDGGHVGGSVLQAAMGETSADPVGVVWAQPEQLSREAHRLDLDPRHVDALGRPVIRCTHGLADDDLGRADFLAARMEQWLLAAGATETWRSPPRAMSVATHAYGGTRMGDVPASSVVDGHGFAHEVPNLAVLGASTFPSTGGRGPTETVEALAWRTADAIAGRL